MPPLPAPESACADDLKWHQGSSDIDHPSPVMDSSVSFKLKSF